MAVFYYCQMHRLATEAKSSKQFILQAIIEPGFIVAYQDYVEISKRNKTIQDVLWNLINSWPKSFKTSVWIRNIT
jgi:hypothetical protein